ncbi:cupin domain-containing protein [Sphingopyxis solisilvae]|uniref:cupin domain-containing protein n=1 Tax=Sphingopyxis solisilvae TaxID=1886788 RepID=UPI001892B13A|nr:cupin domain-containing protein [Sphingopyxis solisilvae]
MNFNRFSTVAAASVALLASTPAFAGTCPTGQVGANPLKDAPTMPSNVTDTVIGSVDLGKEIGVDNRDLRMRRLVVQPGGIVPMHSHAGRPALIIVVSGAITEYRSSCKVGIDHRAGEISSESDGISHWWRNNGKTAAILLSADVKARD